MCVRRVLAGDALCALLAAAAGYSVRFGARVSLGDQQRSLAVVVVLPIVWLAAMAVARCYEQRFLWVGPEEFRRVFFAAMLLLAAVGTLSWDLKLEVARGFIAGALPLEWVYALAGRVTRSGGLVTPARWSECPRQGMAHRGGAPRLEENFGRARAGRSYWPPWVVQRFPTMTTFGYA